MIKVRTDVRNILEARQSLQQIKVYLGQLESILAGQGASLIGAEAVGGNTDVQTILEDHETRLVAGGL